MASTTKRLRNPFGSDPMYDGFDLYQTNVANGGGLAPCLPIDDCHSNHSSSNSMIRPPSPVKRLSDACAVSKCQTCQAMCGMIQTIHSSGHVGKSSDGVMCFHCGWMQCKPCLVATIHQQNIRGCAQCKVVLCRSCQDMHQQLSH